MMVDLQRDINMTSSKIEWTQATWNPISGCTKISPGCKHCYAERMSIRLKAMGVEKYRNEFGLTLHYETLGLPLKWSRPRLIFVNSMSDLFHEKVPFEFVQKIFDVMKKASWHQFQVLTKRSSRLSEIANQLEWPTNIWMGVSVENQEYIYRVENLKQTNAYIKFLSLEPLLGPLPCINLTGIDWVIVGGESGPKSRPILEKWVIDIRDQCQITDTPFFFKQWGGTNKKKRGRKLQDVYWDQMPIQISQ
jgi:protein gp37